MNAGDEAVQAEIVSVGRGGHGRKGRGQGGGAIVPRKGISMRTHGTVGYWNTGPAGRLGKNQWAKGSFDRHLCCAPTVKIIESIAGEWRKNDQLTWNSVSDNRRE